jgi:hypothetical protein
MKSQGNFQGIRGAPRLCSVAILQRPVDFGRAAAAELALTANRGFSCRHGLGNGARAVSKTENLELPGRAFFFGQRFGAFFCILLLLSLGAASNTARAADLSANPAPAEYQPPPADEFSWNGVYAGFNVGGGVDHFGFNYALNTPVP